MMEDELLLVDPEIQQMCPCRCPFRRLEEANGDRNLETDDEDEEIRLWEVLYTCGVLLWMFGALISDRFGADVVMLSALTAFMAAEIISVKEGVAGFSNDGLLTVLTLFVVAEGISKTGALDWYMGKLLGRPATTASAQLRLMAPIAIISAFLNNTPVVAVMIPIVQRWGKNIRISAQQLLIPLSFASILGGTCTLIGTSTNLVVVGLLKERYPNDSSVDIGLFDLSEYGVPIALAGMAYLLMASPFLIPGGKNTNDKDRGAISLDNQEDILMGARLASWSPAVGRSVKRSGLRDTGGIFLVSVLRSTTGNVHRAVGQDFVLNVGDILYFTGLVESFGEFCEEHGLEILTNELEQEQQLKRGDSGTTPPPKPDKLEEMQQSEDDEERPNDNSTQDEIPTLSPWTSKETTRLPVVVEGGGESFEDIPCEVGVTKESLMRADDAERSRGITRLVDLIRGTDRDEQLNGGDEKRKSFGRKRDPAQGLRDTDPATVIVAAERDLIVVGINALDRPGLLLDLSKGLLRLHLTLRHTEASVVGQRSISIWRCEVMDSELPDFEEIWSVLNALLESEYGIQAAKERGLRVIRAVVTKTSSLIGRTAADVDFRNAYKAGIVAIQKGGRNVPLSSVQFASGDVLVLQASDDSPLLKRPPADFYRRLAGQSKDLRKDSRNNSVSSFVNMLRSRSNISLDKLDNKNQVGGGVPQVSAQGAEDAAKSDDSGDDEFLVGGNFLDDDGGHRMAVAISGMADLEKGVEDEIAWKDMQVHFVGEDSGTEGGNEGGATAREFLTAMAVAPNSKLANRTIADIGLDKLPGVFLVSIDRPSNEGEGNKSKVSVLAVPTTESRSSVAGSVASIPTIEPIFVTISPEAPLKEGDVLWFAGSASSVGDLRKIPGLISNESDEVEKINEKVFDRRLVEAVIGRRGPLVGKTVKEVRFRTRFGAAVIAVHREGKRVHEHPGKIKLQAGDVLLLEAGPTFIKKSFTNDRSFALLAEVEDSAPPRLSLLIPALVITAAMLIVFTAGVASLFVCALVASILMVAIGIMSEQEARDAVNWDVYITIAAAFGIGTALENSGVAGGIANFLVNIGEKMGIGDAGLLGAVYFATFLISNVVTNNAAAALLFPIALDAAEQTGTDRLIMSYALMLGASASFMSPFGYTTNLLIYGPGGYTTKDFLIIGTPMQLVLWLLSILFLSISGTPWWVTWTGTAVALGIVVAFQIYGVGFFWQQKKHTDVTSV